MSEEEAIEWLEIIKEALQYNDINYAITEKGRKSCEEAINIILNLIQKDKDLEEG